jgi:hypothetical protein
MPSCLALTLDTLAASRLANAASAVLQLLHSLHPTCPVPGVAQGKKLWTALRLRQMQLNAYRITMTVHMPQRRVPCLLETGVVALEDVIGLANV